MIGLKHLRTVAVAAAAFAACLPTAVFAQHGPAAPSPQAMHAMVSANINRALAGEEQMLTKQLSLSHPQQVKLHRIGQKYLPKLVSLESDALDLYTKAQQGHRGNSQAAMMNLQTRQKAISNGMKSDVEAILSTSQRKKLAAVEASQRAAAIARMRQLQKQRGMLGAPGSMGH